jgi:hypothetical protein
MKLSTIALAGALAMSSSSFALAQAGGANSGAAVPETSGAPVNAQGGVVDNGSMDHRTTGNAREPMGSGNPNRPDGPTSLSGSGPSTFGGNSPAVVK